HEITNAVVYLGIVNRRGHVDLVKAVAILKLAAVGIFFLTQARQVTVMITTATFAQLTKNLFKSRLTDSLFAPGRDPYFASARIIAEVALVFEFLYKVADAVVVVRQPILLIQFIEPRQGFCCISGRVLQQLHEKLQQLLETAFWQCIGNVLRKIIAAHMVHLKQYA